MLRKALLATALAASIPTTAFPQALTSLQSLRVAYNTRKTTLAPQGELKAQIDEIDRQIAEASRVGRTAEIRRLIAKGQTLLAGGSWTDALDYSNSLVIRTEHVVADSGKPLDVRLEQFYSPAIELPRPLGAHALLRKRPTPAPAGGVSQPGDLVKDLGEVDGVGRDLRDIPQGFEFEVRDVPEGTYQLVIDVSDETRPLGSATLLVHLRKGLDDMIVKLETEAKRAPEAVRADILYPIDRMRNVNRGRLELRTFDPERDFADAQAVALGSRGGRSAFGGRTGDFKRHYHLDAANEILPYRMYVPTSYNGTKPFPVVVLLHGLGGTEDSFFDGYEKRVPALAERHGYIVAAPLGYRVDGSYGWGLGNPPPDPATRRIQDLSEQDVMHVLEMVKQRYKIDENRIYLAGHSMGAIGTWKIAPKTPDIWAAIATFAGSGVPATLERIKHVPEYVVHGDNDATVNVQGSRAMVSKAKELGIEVAYVEVPGGTHGGVVPPNLAGMFDFFDAHKKRGRPTSQH